MKVNSLSHSNDYSILVAVYDIEIVKAWKEVERCEVMWEEKFFLLVLDILMTK